jgi:hypothetical protein
MSQFLLDLLSVSGFLAGAIALGVLINWLVFKDGA